MKIPVLVYHDVLPEQEFGHLSRLERHYCLSEEHFNSHLKYLSENDFKTVSLYDKLDHAKKPIILSFDDGLVSNYECYLNLKKFNLNAIFFIVTDWIGSDGYLSWKQLREMNREGMKIQSHTRSHPILTTISIVRLQEEFTLSKKVIEDKLGNLVNSVSIPQGFANETVLREAQKSGYEFIYTSEPGIHDLMRGGYIRRLSIYHNTSFSKFKRLVNGNSYEVKKQIMYKNILQIPKKILGDKFYHFIRTRIMGRM